MNLNLKDKVFIITGGAAGIGEAITKTALLEGAKVAIVGRGNLKDYPIASFLEVHESKYLFLKTELTNPDECKKAVEDTINKFGSLYCLVNNAGINDGIGLQTGDPQKFQTSLNNNLIHYYSMHTTLCHT